MSSVFLDYATYYDLLYRDKDYLNEVEILDDLLKEYIGDNNNILEFGTGTGKHASLLSKRGYNLTGVELSNQMISLIKDPLIKNKTYQGDIRTFKIESKFNAILSLFHVISYMVENSDLDQVFQNANNHLNKEGIFIFDVWHLPAVLHHGVETRIKRVKENDIELLRLTEAKLNKEKNTCLVNFSIYLLDTLKKTYENIFESHNMRYFTPDEISNHGEKNGFKIVQTIGFPSKKEPDRNTWGVLYVLKKIENI